MAVLCEIVDDDGSMAGLPKLREFAQAEKLKIISTADLIRTLMTGLCNMQSEISDDQDILVRVHSEGLTGYVFGSARCRGIGLGHKLRAYNLQDDGHDTVEANEELYLLILGNTGIGAQILGDLGVHTMSLMKNNPAKYVGLKGYGLAISGRVPLLNPITKENKRYLETKQEKLGHI
ncbi:hypothetical protein Goari_002565 [Gossypium aridum]|uniref:3,4-dihydroxy-2-butanone-4-phosphate synthase n=1 Tax=Gossypium aridum TaxID=34290 RepID=A0A7J8Y965_GOSAI|nr:hypothetical protein [Gossypium aridum]